MPGAASALIAPHLQVTWAMPLLQHSQAPADAVLPPQPLQAPTGVHSQWRQSNQHAGERKPLLRSNFPIATSY